MKTVFMFDDRLAVGYYRAVSPALELREELLKDGIVLICDQKLEPGAGYFNGYIFHGYMRPEYMSFLLSLRQDGARIAHELDDDLWHVPDWNPGKPQPENLVMLDWCLDMSDLVIASTEHLASVINREHCVICPNLVNPKHFLPKPEPASDDPVRILWPGSLHHEFDTDDIIAAVERIVAEYGPRVQFLFWGFLPTGLGTWHRLPREPNLGAYHTDFKRFGSSVGFIPPCYHREYHEQLGAIAPDIGIAPLSACEFNRSKSAIKWLEMTMAGAAFVGTALEPYSCVEDGHDGLLVEPGDTDGWYRALKWLIDSRSLRLQMVEKAQAKVYAEHTWTSPVPRKQWLDAIRRLVQ